MANPLAKCVINNIAKKINDEGNIDVKNCRIDNKYEDLLKDVIHKREKDDPFKALERKEINGKRMMTLEEFSLKCFGKNKDI